LENSAVINHETSYASISAKGKICSNFEDLLIEEEAIKAMTGEHRSL
jgi:hypothetical protein